MANKVNPNIIKPWHPAGNFYTKDEVDGMISGSGYSGTSGYSGASTSGYSGVAGATGTSGYSGIGTSGHSGVSGATGAAGAGDTGTSGYVPIGAGTGVASVFRSIWRDSDTNEDYNVLIQTGQTACADAGTAITFDIEFTSTPRVVASKVGGTAGMVSLSSIGTTGFTGRCYKFDGTGSLAGTIDWIAIGRKNP